MKALASVRPFLLSGNPLAPVTTIDAATSHFTINWTEPDDRGDPITSYLIEIADKATGNAWTADKTLPGRGKRSLLAPSRRPSYATEPSRTV